MGQKDDIFDYAIYHRGCLDGFSGFFVAHLSGRLSKDVFVYADIPSAKNIPPNIVGKNIIIIDVAYKKEILSEIVQLSKKVVFIDHHVSIAEDNIEIQKKYSKKMEIVYDSERSGATLTWMYFNPRQIAPLFLKYIEDQDTGKWQYENTKPFILALKSNYHLSYESKSLNKWFRLLNKKAVISLVEEGLIMQKYLSHLVNVNLPRHTMHNFPSSKVFKNLRAENPSLFSKPAQYKIALFCGFNCPSITDLSTEALERIDCDFTIMWTYNLDRKEYVFSMRSREVDVSVIAKAFGGGGHKLAAAFSFARQNYDVEDMFEGPSLPRSLKPIEGVFDA